MSKPDFNSLGITAELTLHERALRAAQNEITCLKSECAMWRSQNEALRKELAVLKAPSGPLQPPAAITDQQIMRAINASLDRTPFPPHHSTVGMDGEGRVQG